MLLSDMFTSDMTVCGKGYQDSSPGKGTGLWRGVHLTTLVAA